MDFTYSSTNPIFKTKIFHHNTENSPLGYSSRKSESGVCVLLSTDFILLLKYFSPISKIFFPILLSDMEIYLNLHQTSRTPTANCKTNSNTLNNRNIFLPTYIYFFFDYKNIFDGNVSILVITNDKASTNMDFFCNFFFRKIKGVSRLFREKFKKNQIMSKSIEVWPNSQIGVWLRVL